MTMRENSTLTPNQRKVYGFIEEYIAKWGQSPTVLELRDMLKVSSLRTVTQYLEALEAKGFIHRSKFQKRGIKLVSDGPIQPETVLVPVVSSAGCDNLNVIADQTFDEYIRINSEILRNKKPQETVVIRAVGQSMVDAGIQDGDYVLTQITTDVIDGDLVVAIIEGMAVIKKISFATNAVILNPVSHDPSYHPIIMTDDFKVFGKVVKIIKLPKQTTLEYIYD